MNGVIVIDKPAGLTSHDVVNRMRRLLGQREVGHLGTLDPSATGVLPLVLGKLTRLAQFYNDSEKSYQGTIRFGLATDTYDAEGEPSGPAQPVLFDWEELEQAAAHFRGRIEQMPPPFSAKKIHGVPAYKLARKKKEVQLKPVQVEIKELEISGFEEERATFRARVGSGTYMRCVAHDLGQRLGCGAHLASLRRTAFAEFSIDDAYTLEKIQEILERSPVSELFMHPRKLLPEFPSVTANEESAAKIRAGRAVNLPELSRASRVKVFYGQRELIAIATRVAGSLFHPKVVLATEPAHQLIR
jgi:tRNA pseudouridine55 synthase